MKGSQVTISGVHKQFGDFVALDNIDFTIKQGEFFTLLGPSGCGKTTLLRILAGFEFPDEGEILFDDIDVTELPPNKRLSNTVFQNYALFPHLSVYENVAFPLRLKKLPKNEIDEKVRQYVHLVELDEHIYKKPNQLSGGQRQRVAIARALINEPKVLLLDEPLSALDAKLRSNLLVELDRLHDKIGITFIFVTHDQSEALAVSDRIAVMNHGHVLQVGTPYEIYESPATQFVAQFIGAIAGAAVLNGIVKDTSKLGTNALYNGDALASFVIEAVLTCIFVLAILGVTSKKENGSIAGLVIGGALTLVHLLGINFTGTSVNPARSFGPALIAGQMSGIWVFLLAPLVGGILAALIYGFLEKKHQECKSGTCNLPVMW